MRSLSWRFVDVRPPKYLRLCVWRAQRSEAKTASTLGRADVQVRVPKKRHCSQMCPSPCPVYVHPFPLCTCSLGATRPFRSSHACALRGHVFGAAFKNLALILDQFTIPMKQTCRTCGANSGRLSGLHGSCLICDFSLHSHSCGSPR